jgi:hypothetical protein
LDLVHPTQFHLLVDQLVLDILGHLVVLGYPEILGHLVDQLIPDPDILEILEIQLFLLILEHLVVLVILEYLVVLGYLDNPVDLVI